MSGSAASGRAASAVTGTAAGGGLFDLLRLICETPAPTFEEDERGQLLAALFRSSGLEPEVDAVGNVVANVPGGAGPRVLLAAHLDTVFAADVDVTVREEGGLWRAPGVGDNSASLAVLVHLIRNREGTSLPRLVVAATVGEEGLGDLRGMRVLLERDSSFDFVVAVDGHLGTVVNVAVGSKRYEFRLEAKGGHSWGDYPSPSAVHAAGAMIHALTRITIPRSPRASMNVGQVWGGTGVNAIAQEAGFNLDLRSVDPELLARLEREALESCRRVAARQRVDLSIEKVGDRPAAEPESTPLTRLARQALSEVGVEARTVASSTDANVAMAAGIPAVSFGVYSGGDAHRMSEWLQPDSLEVGYLALLALLKKLARLPGGH